MNAWEGCASMCDCTGHLLFYTDGLSVWKKNHQLMNNGDGLLGGSSTTQAAIILPKPGSSTIYYVFTCPYNLQEDSFRYSVVDMTLDNGFGDVVEKNVAIYEHIGEKLTATIKGNGVDYWIVVKQLGTDAFLSYSLTSAGLNMTPVISHAGNIADPVTSNGYVRISRDGTKMVSADAFISSCQLFDFDNNTGQISNPLDLTSLTAGYQAYGAEFSSDNSKLYITAFGTGVNTQTYVLTQFDLAAGSPAAIQNSGVEILHQHIYNYPLAAGWVGALKLAPDNKLYIARLGEPYISAIEFPNLAFPACNYIDQAIMLSTGSICNWGLPNNVYLPPSVCLACPVISNFSSNVSICANQTYQLPWGPIVSAAGNYHDTIRNVTGLCDSIIYSVSVSMYNVSLLNTFIHICPGQIYTLPSGTIVNAEGVYSDTLRNIAGCDSVINTVNLFVDHALLENTEVHICPGQVYMLPSGTVVNAAGVYQDTIRSQASCDSVIKTIYLFIDQPALRNTEIHICPGQVYMLPSGTVVNTAGVYLDTLRSQAYCDSIINTIQLYIDHAALQSADAHICSNQAYALPSGMIVNASGVYVDTLRSQASCDSIISTINLTVNDHSYSNHTDSIDAGQTYTLPSGAVVNDAGVYQSILVNSFGCDSIITTTLKLKKAVAECITLKNAITPNGDGINDYWVLYKYNCFKRMEVNIYNRYGTIVYHSDDYKNDWNGQYKNKQLPDGTYYYNIKVISHDGRETVFKNNVTILR